MSSVSEHWTRYVQTRVQDWTRVRILTGPVITDHWTEAQPKIFQHLNIRPGLSHMNGSHKETRDVTFLLMEISRRPSITRASLVIADSWLPLKYNVLYHWFKKEKAIKERSKSGGNQKLVPRKSCEIMGKGINFHAGGPGKVVDLTEQSIIKQVEF